MDVEIFLNTPSLLAYRIDLKKGEEIPLHDHPNMTVFLTVLKGQLQSHTYECLEKSDTTIHLKLIQENILLPGQHGIIEPHRNYHQLRALEEVTFIDVASPGYMGTDIQLNFYEILSHTVERTVAQPIEEPLALREAKRIAHQNFHQSPAVSRAS